MESKVATIEEHDHQVNPQDSVMEKARPHPAGYTRPSRPSSTDNIPDFLHENYDRSDIGPLVLRKRVTETFTRPSEAIEREHQSQNTMGDHDETSFVHHKTVEIPIEAVEREHQSKNLMRDRDETPFIHHRIVEKPLEHKSKPLDLPIHRRRIGRKVDSAIWDISRAKDITFHLELDTTEDLELDLEEFNRLSRLGNFRAAKRFFRDNLEQYIENPYIFVQYAQMLMEMGDYQNVRTLDIPASLYESANQVLLTYWKLIDLLSTIRIEGLSDAETQIAIPPPGFLGRGSTLGSTECQTLGLSTCILSYGAHKFDKPIMSFDWKFIYNEMLRQGRIWDFRDVFIGATHYYPYQEICDEVFEVGLDSSNLISRITTDWLTATYDETTHVALLDLLISLVLSVRFLAAVPSTMAKYDFRIKPLMGRLASAAQYIDKAGDLVSTIIQNDPSKLKSRQYIRWILTKFAATNYQPISHLAFQSVFYGMFLETIQGVDLIIYVPGASETPDWNHIYLPSKSIAPLQTALEAARKLEDYQTEVLCLKQLILHSQHPGEFFDQLIHLQKLKQHDIAGWLETCLSKYIICRDEKSRDDLREEILSVDNYKKLYVHLQWARCIVLRALAHSNRDSSLLLSEAKELLQDIRIFGMWAFMKNNRLITVDEWEARPKDLFEPSVLGEQEKNRHGGATDLPPTKQKDRMERLRPRNPLPLDENGLMIANEREARPQNPFKPLVLGEQRENRHGGTMDSPLTRQKDGMEQPKSRSPLPPEKKQAISMATIMDKKKRSSPEPESRRTSSDEEHESEDSTSPRRLTTTVSSAEQAD